MWLDSVLLTCLFTDFAIGRMYTLHYAPLRSLTQLPGQHQHPGELADEEATLAIPMAIREKKNFSLNAYCEYVKTWLIIVRDTSLHI